MVLSLTIVTSVLGTAGGHLMMTQAFKTEFLLTDYVSTLLWVLDNVTCRGRVRAFAEWTLWFTSSTCDMSISSSSVE